MIVALIKILLLQCDINSIYTVYMWALVRIVNRCCFWKAFFYIQGHSNGWRLSHGLHLHLFSATFLPKFALIRKHLVECIARAPSRHFSVPTITTSMLGDSSFLYCHILLRVECLYMHVAREHCTPSFHKYKKVLRCNSFLVAALCNVDIFKFHIVKL